MQQNLFDQDSQDPKTQHPLPYQMRPQGLENFVGQKKVIKFLTQNLKQLPHMVLWGPPGTGKTSLAHLLAKLSQKSFFPFNAVTSGIPLLKSTIQEMEDQKKLYGKSCLLFIDEVHRFNKAQQDVLLPYLEKADFLFIGATTEYPQTSLNRALISRVELLGFEKLSEEDITQILDRANKGRKTPREFIELISKYSNGDARMALNFLSKVWAQAPKNKEELLESLATSARQYDKNSNRHYDVISAFIKSVRGSDPNAALIWLAVMLDGGEDPRFIARRLIILASEDIGLADPRGLEIACNAHYATQNIGMPEARIILSQATIYLCQAPKSNRAYLAMDIALEFVRENPTLEVPGHLRNYGPEKENYLYPHNYPNSQVEQSYLPVGVGELDLLKD